MIVKGKEIFREHIEDVLKTTGKDLESLKLKDLDSLSLPGITSEIKLEIIEEMKGAKNPEKRSSVIMENEKKEKESSYSSELESEVRKEIELKVKVRKGGSKTRSVTSTPVLKDKKESSRKTKYEETGDIDIEFAKNLTKHKEILTGIIESVIGDRILREQNESGILLKEKLSDISPMKHQKQLSIRINTEIYAKIKKYCKKMEISERYFAHIAFKDFLESVEEI